MWFKFPNISVIHWHFKNFSIRKEQNVFLWCIIEFSKKNTFFPFFSSTHFTFLSLAHFSALIQKLVTKTVISSIFFLLFLFLFGHKFTIVHIWLDKRVFFVSKVSRQHDLPVWIIKNNKKRWFVAHTYGIGWIQCIKWNWVVTVVEPIKYVIENQSKSGARTLYTRYCVSCI